MSLQMTRFLSFFFFFFFLATNSIFYIYHNLFIHSSILKHLGCPHFLATVNNAAVNMRVHISFELVFLLSLGKQPEVGFACGSSGKESACNAGDLGFIPGLGRSTGERKGYPFHCSGLENSVDCIVHGITKSRTWLSIFHFHFFPEVVEWLDHMVIIFLICWRSFILFSIMAVPIFIATNYAWMFPFLHILINTSHFISFYNSYSSRFGGNLSSWFLFAFLWWLVKLSTFSCFCQPHVCLLWKRKCLFSSILCYWFLHVFQIFTPFQIFPTQGSNLGLLHCRQSLLSELLHMLYEIFNLQIFSPIW